MADDGNYNIQVISESLKRIGNLKCESIDSEIFKGQDMRYKYSETWLNIWSYENGFICNSSNHWIAIRKINGKWYNLNSTNREGPEMISDFYLRLISLLININFYSAFLHSVRENGYIIFVVQGDFPHYDKSV